MSTNLKSYGLIPYIRVILLFLYINPLNKSVVIHLTIYGKFCPYFT